jgi:FdrA protein
VRPGAYYDSVVLMRLQRALAGLPGVHDAGAVMATAANLEILAANGLAPENLSEAGPHDLLIAVRAESGAAAAEALARVDALLEVRRSGGDEDYRPRSLAAAGKLLPEAGWVLVSIPGRHAAAVADEALDQGRNVFLYSDNVPLAEEVALKRKARERGLLVLGPDCGTTVLGCGGAADPATQGEAQGPSPLLQPSPSQGGRTLRFSGGDAAGVQTGIGLGFANRVRRGPIGLIGASGTGLQAVMSRIHELGSGISHAIGTGGRDLSREVGGITALQALDLLRRDPETRVLVLISKPPAPEVAVRLLGLARAAGKPVVVQLLGAPLPARRLANLHFAASLTEAAELAVRLADNPPPHEPLGAPIPANRPYLRGLFSGGTLAFEALLGLSAVLAPVYSNIPLTESQRLPDPLRSQGHTVLDLGADEFTVGRLHPMIDPDLRLRRLRQEAADPEVGLILLDVVLGEGAHADPAGELVPAIEAIRAAGGPEIGVVLIGTDLDPQGLGLQAETLERAGVGVCRDVGELVDVAVHCFPPVATPLEGMPVPLSALHAPIAALNVGLETFYDSLRAQGAAAVQVDWSPPAGGNEKLAGILARMKNR